MTVEQTIPGRFAVVGNPIKHSLSPIIHASFAAQIGQAIDYQAHCVDPPDFEAWVRAFFEQSGRGLNVTLPFKTRAFELADSASERARQAGAANFLRRDSDGRIHADNTDGKGLITDIRDGAGWSLTDARILVLGAGGAVKGVMASLLAQAPKKVFVANRTAAKAAALAAGWSDQNVPVGGGGYEDIGSESWDLIINGTSTGLSDDMPPLPPSLGLADPCCCYDMAYGSKPTPFLIWAKAHGAREVRDGLGMLVEQAAESFNLWLGERPETQAVVEALRLNATSSA